MYLIKEIFYSLQGEGAHTGRPAIFLRFSGCNLWSGRESDRNKAICQFCDTDFVGTNGQNGGKYQLNDLISVLLSLWPENSDQPPYVICTGGEPALQLDQKLVIALHKAQFEIGIETNGTRLLPDDIDWICISPKGNAEVVLTRCNELKLVYPQQDCHPAQFDHFEAEFKYLSPQNPPNLKHLVATDQNATKATIDYCLRHPQWRLCLQTHKILNID